MGGCVSRPKELDDAKYKSVQDNKPKESAVSPNPIEGDDNAPAEKVKPETATEPEMKEELLVDLSEPQPEDEKKEEVVFSPEFSALTVNPPEVMESVVAKEETPVADEAAVTEEEVVEEKTKESVVVADEQQELKTSA